MLTVRQVHEVQLPQPATGMDGTLPIVLEVLPGNTFAINREPVSAGDLLARLLHLYADRPKITHFIRGHRHVTYQDVYTAIGVARGAGVRAIGVDPRE